jgi:hypothetical protein
MRRGPATKCMSMCVQEKATAHEAFMVCRRRRVTFVLRVAGGARCAVVASRSAELACFACLLLVRSGRAALSVVE